MKKELTDDQLRAMARPHFCAGYSDQIFDVVAFARQLLSDKDAEIARLKAEVESWYQQNQQHIDDANTFGAERDELKSELEALRKDKDAEIAALRKDAERLDFMSKLRRWIHSGDGHYVSRVTIKWGDSIKRKNLRAAVDLAIAQAVQPTNERTK